MKKLIMILISVFAFNFISKPCDCKYSKYGYYDTYMIKANSKKSKLNTYLSSININQIRPYDLSYGDFYAFKIYTVKFIYKNDRVEFKVCTDTDDGMLNYLKINNKQFSRTEFDKSSIIKLQKLIYKRYHEYFSLVDKTVKISKQISNGELN